MHQCYFIDPFRLYLQQLREFYVFIEKAPDVIDAVYDWILSVFKSEVLLCVLCFHVWIVRLKLIFVAGVLFSQLWKSHH